MMVPVPRAFVSTRTCPRCPLLAAAVMSPLSAVEELLRLLLLLLLLLSALLLQRGLFAILAVDNPLWNTLSGCAIPLTASPIEHSAPSEVCPPTREHSSLLSTERHPASICTKVFSTCAPRQSKGRAEQGRARQGKEGKAGQGGGGKTGECKEDEKRSIRFID